jgi:probable HAF family extracellular repeat protein
VSNEQLDGTKHRSSSRFNNLLTTARDTYSNGAMTDLGTLGSPEGTDWWNSAQGINRSGEVVGTSYNAQGNFLGFVWSNGKMRSLGTLGSLWSEGFAINNKGQTTGIAYLANGEAHAFLETNGKMIDLGNLAGAGFATWGFAINDSGVVAGQADVPSGYHAFVYSAGKKRPQQTYSRRIGMAS